MDENSLKNLASQLRKPSGEEGITTGEWMFNHNGNMIRRAIDLLQIKDGQEILEMGFGNGAHLDYLFSKANIEKYTGVDISETMLEEATRRNQEKIKVAKAEFLLTNGIQIPLAAGKFDKFFTVNTIYFWEDHSAVLKEILRVLIPGGRISMALASRNYLETLPFTKYGFQLFSPEEVSKLIKDNGFKLLEIKTENDEVKTENQEVLSREILFVIAEKQ